MKVTTVTVRGNVDLDIPEIIEALRPFAEEAELYKGVQIERGSIGVMKNCRRARTVFLKLGGKLDET